MKKLIILLFIPLLFTCSSDDSSDELGSIEGRWYFTEYYEDGEELILGDCDLETYLDLLQDGTGYAYIYYTDGPPEPCGLDIIYSISYYSVSNTVNTFSITVDYGDGYYATAEGILDGDTLTLTGSDGGSESNGVDFISIYTRN
tara:strand:- start:55 stop:486 length:432 start_codon:yes stop_codon:yes gene_type:complete